MFQAFVKVYPDYVLSIRQVTHQIKDHMLILFVKARNLGTCLEPVYLSDFMEEPIENNILSLEHNKGRELFHLPKLDESQQSKINSNNNNSINKCNENNHKISKEVLKLDMRIYVKFYISLEFNMIVGWDLQSKVGSFEVFNSNHFSNK